MNEVPKEFLEMVENDIERIDRALSSSTKDGQWSLFRVIDGRYQSCIQNWYTGMWGSSKEGTYLRIDELVGSSFYIQDNLKFAKSKLETYRFQMNAVTVPQVPSTNVSVTNMNSINIGISFEEARQKIEEMTALDDAQANEIKGKISELEAISKEQSSRRAKWEKVKPIINSVLKFGADAALVVLQAVLQMKLAN